MICQRPITVSIFLSTPSARRATQHILVSVVAGADISIHALREEGDISPESSQTAAADFYPRPPRGGRRGVAFSVMSPDLISIHALREEGDIMLPMWRASTANFYPRPPRGGRLPMLQLPPQIAGISIHALREEGDRQAVAVEKHKPISIHALREEGDIMLPMWRASTANFYPRPPRGGRHGLFVGGVCPDGFLSTPSARRATPASSGRSGCWTYFYPRPPRGGRQRPGGRDHEPDEISIHALREEGDRAV